MKIVFAMALLALAGWSAPALAQANNTSLVDNYVVTGTESNGKPYDGPGPLVITMDKSGALELKWDNGKYTGVGQVVGNQLMVASYAEGRQVLGIKDINPDRSLEGKWWRRADTGTKGTEVWKKK